MFFCYFRVKITVLHPSVITYVQLLPHARREGGMEVVDTVLVSPGINLNYLLCGVA